ncbi:MAG: hypothetical protein PVI50_04000 [Gammaproteobacteria bacterium]|jgi:hypothetical protein
MLRGSFLVFILGWLAWFWIDKPDPQRLRLPPSGDSLVADFQQGFDMLRAGYWDAAFVYLWNAHYLILSLLGGALLAVIYGSVSDRLGRWRMRRLMFPQRGGGGRKGGEDGKTGPDSTPPDPE